MSSTKTVFISPIMYILSKRVKNVDNREENRNLMIRWRSCKFMQRLTGQCKQCMNKCGQKQKEPQAVRMSLCP